MLPLGLLTAAQGRPMLVELKNGETLNGHLVTCDNWMNLILREVVQTSPEGDRFFRLPEVYVRGNNIKYLRVPEEIVDIVKEQQQNQPQNRRGGHGRDGDRGRGRGRGGGRGGRGRGRGGADSGTLHAALKALAVHPDYVLRQDVLRMLRDRWLTVSPDGWHFNVAGLLRDHQFELALDQISLMERKGMQITNWLHSMVIYQLCDFQELDEVYRLMQARVEQGHDMTPELWAHVLKTASKALHYDLTRFIWRRQVDLGYLEPSQDIYGNAMAVASDAGDIDLALAIFRSCDNRGFPLKAQDYHRLVEIYLRSGDLAATFKLFCTMQELGLVPAEHSTEAVVSHMIERNTDPREAWQMLKHLKNEKWEVPIGCVRIIAELCEQLAHDDPSVVDDAVGFYKELYTLCPEGADVRVYNSLIRMCRHGQNRQSGLFLVKEMASFGVVPDAITFESLILMCLDARNYQSAYMYLRDLLDRGDEVSDETRKQIRDLCSQSVHEFAVRLQHHPAVQAVERAALPEHNVDEEPRDKSRNKADETGHRRYGRPWVRAAFRRQALSDEDRIAWNKKRRQNKRRHQAIARKAEAEN
ncbi:Ribonucleoprotein LSM domain eukaryotic/archaea-type [Penicillium sp. IBT 35674x]|nr:Ribonucleoprotein LSM domain eukaryotic/archaea-type [Penicillium sp. IBT 35674x]